MKFVYGLCLIFFVLFVGCTSTNTASQAPANTGNQESELDKAIEKAGQQIALVLKDGSRVAVFSFYSPSERLSEYALEELSAYLVNTRNFDIVERRHLDEVRKELQFNLSGEVSDESAQSIGKMLGAQYIVVGTFERLGNTWRMRTTTLHVETAKKEIVTSARINANDNDIEILLRNATPRRPEDVIRSRMDGTWRLNDTLWTFDNNNITIETPEGAIIAGTFLYNDTSFNITLLRYKERVTSIFWSTFETPGYSSFQYVITGNRMFIEGYFYERELNAVMTRE